ncbi:MAG: dienelactone hydrolase family protein, partial [Myxococcales bacterium]|nr:dienelactone hydrolase family protein [Myxococcales bacterium]
LAATRPGAGGVVLLHAALPPAAFGLDAWPDVPTAIHAGDRDPWVDPGVLDAFDALPTVEVHRYATAAHLFTDSDSEEHDDAESERLVAEVRRFLRSV